MKPTTAQEVAADKLRRENIERLAAQIENLATHLALDEMSAVMGACGTIRCAARGHVMRMVKTEPA